MRRNRIACLILVLLVVSGSGAQVVGPGQIKDLDLRSLQLQYMDDLQSVGKDILATHFDYAFFLSRKLDLDQAAQQRADQNSIRFDRYSGRVVLAITGNYYAAYSSDKMSEEQRARSSFTNVVLPILKCAVPRFQNNPSIQGYAVEISHHILGKVMSVSMERPENLMVFLPQRAALKLLAAKDETAEQAAILEGNAFLNAVPVTIWVSEDGPRLAPHTPDTPGEQAHSPSGVGAEIVSGEGKQSSPSASPLTAPSNPAKLREAPAPPPRDTSPAALAAIQAVNDDTLNSIVKELAPQAHFVSYAPPKFIAFRQAIYLELSINTSLAESAIASRYKLAALAFDEHVAHLVRPTLGYFKGEQAFDGLGFSTTVHLTGKSPQAASYSEAVEFFFPFAALRCYETYDCTGQQLIDAGTVLINGERVGLELQNAEADPR